VLSSRTFGVSEQIAILALALLAYEGSIAIGGNGFVAAFARASCRGRDQAFNGVVLACDRPGVRAYKGVMSGPC